MKIPAHLLLAAALAAPTLAFADGATPTLPETDVIPEAIEGLNPPAAMNHGETPEVGTEPGETLIEPIVGLIEGTLEVPEIDWEWDDCPGCGMG